MNSQDHQQYVPSARDNVDVITIGHIDVESIQSDVDFYLKELHDEWKASIPFTCYVINENNQQSFSPLRITLSKIDTWNTWEDKCILLQGWHFVQIHTSHPLPMMK
jgi:hypothetical protein